MTATSFDLSAIKSDVLSSAANFRQLIGLGTLATQSPTGTANSTTYLRGDFTWQTISGGGTWGSITGTLSSQTDLQNALNAKASLSGATFTGAIGINAGTLNGTVLDVSQTWGGTGTYTGLKYNVTDSGPANAASLLMDLQVGGSSKFKVDKAGAATFTGLVSATANVEHRLGQSVVWGDGDWGARWKWSGGGNGVGMAVGSFLPAVSSAMSLGEWGYTGWTNLYLATGANGANNGVVLVPDSVHTLGIRNATSAQALRIYNTYTNDSNYERAKIAWSSNVLQIGTEKLGTGAARALELQTDGTTRASIPTTGGLVVGTAALATNATSGFLYVPTCAGTPSGTPASQTGTAPIVIDTTNNKLYFYSGGAWRDAGP